MGEEQFTQLEEMDIDFRVPGSSRFAAEKNVYNPSSNKSKEWNGQCGRIRVVRDNTRSIMFPISAWFNIEESVTNLRREVVSIPNYVIKKVRSHAVRHGKTEEQEEYHTAWNAW